jgi:hypothetical protein
VDCEAVFDLLEYWQEMPPIEVLAAAWMGFKPPSERTPAGPLKLIADRPPQGLQSLRARFPGGTIRTH